MDIKSHESFFEFSNPELLRSVFVVNPDFSSNEKDESQMSISSRVMFPKRNDENSTKKHAVVQVTVGNQADLSFKNNEPYFLEVPMGAKFLWPKEIEKETFETLLNNNAPLLLLSYIRPIVSEVTEKSRYNTVHIPFIDFAHADNND